MLVRRPGRWRPVVVVVACVAALTLGSGTANATAISASKWVTAVCAAETTLHLAVQSKFDALNAASSAGDVAAIKAAFADLVAALSAPTKTLSSSLKKAGVPKITNGTKIVQTYVNTVQSIAKQLPVVKSKVAALPTTDLATFMTALGAVLTPVMNLTQTADKKVQTLDKGGKVATSLSDCGGVFAAGRGQSGGAPATGAPASGGGGQGGGAPATLAPGGGGGQGGSAPAATAPGGGGGQGAGAPASVPPPT